MARPNQEAIETFMSITGLSEAIAVQRLEEHGGNLNEAINAHFSEGDRNITHETYNAASQSDAMDIDDPVRVESHRPPFSLFSNVRERNPFSLLDHNFGGSLFDSGPGFTSRAPFVSHPREVREIPIEVKDGTGQPGQSGLAPAIEDVTENADIHGPETHGNVIIDDDDAENIPAATVTHAAGWHEAQDDLYTGNSYGAQFRPNASGIDNFPDFNNDIEEEMIQAAIEASKKEAENGYPNQLIGAENDLSDPRPQPRQSQREDDELAQAVLLSLKTAEQEKASRELGVKVEASESEASRSSEVGEAGKLASSDGRLDLGSSSFQADAEDVEEQPLVRHRSKRMSSGSVEPTGDIGEREVNLPSSPGLQNNINHPHNGNEFPSDEWGGISSQEHDEAVMLEAALFGGIPEGNGYPLAYAPHQLMQNGTSRATGPYPWQTPRPPSPNLAAQRLIREQQDDEYLASLQADREKELKAMEEAEARLLEEQAAREAALEEERRKEEELHRKLEEEQELERQLAAKEASLPQEPTSDDDNAVTVLVRMPDGNRCGRRFLKSNKLQCLFDFIDVGREFKPGTYRLVRPYPRRAFGDAESGSTLNELGLTSKQEALFLELI